MVEGAAGDVEHLPWEQVGLQVRRTEPINIDLSVGLLADGELAAIQTPPLPLLDRTP
jgi:hypothetical protein